MLASFVITLQVDHDVTPPELGGEALHGLYFVEEPLEADIGSKK